MAELELGKPDIAWLTDFLLSERAPIDAMYMSELDGFLAAIAIGPELLQFAEWLDVVWGEEGGGFLTNEDANRAITAIMSRYNEILQTLDADPPTYAPIFARVEGDEEELADDWCRGFMWGIGLRAKAWGPLLQSRRHGEIMLPIYAHLPDEARIELGGDFLDAEFRQHAKPMIPNAVQAIHRYWKKKRRGQEGVVHLQEIPIRVRAAPKVGRNAPCPCGSGAKYKKCCGAGGAEGPTQ